MNATVVADGILVTWDEPLFPNGVLQYEVTLQQMDLATPENIFQDRVNVISERELTFSVTVRPYHRYTATVIPFTADPVRGNPTSDIIQTEEDSK